MQNSIQDNNEQLEGIRNDIMAVKSIISYFKHSGIPNRLSLERRLIQASKTRFGTYVTVAQRFKKSVCDVKLIAAEQVIEHAKQIYDSLPCSNSDSPLIEFQALNAIVDVLEQFRAMKNIMETNSKPVLHHLRPPFECLKNLKNFDLCSTA